MVDRKKHFNVTITYKNGEQSEFLANEIDLDFESAAKETTRGLPHKFTYVGTSGEQVPLYLVLGEVVGVSVAERWR